MLRLPAFWMVPVAAVVAASMAAMGAVDRSPSTVFALSTCSADPFFSEYVEGTSNNKAVEIFNGADAPLDLTGYTVDVYANGSATSTASIALSGIVAPGDVYVLAAQDIVGLQDQISAALSFNGNDVVTLEQLGEILDVIGDPGVDPGVQWGVDPLSTQDNTLQRLSSVSGGRTTLAPDFNSVLPVEWSGLVIDTFLGLGSHTADCFSGVQPTPTPDAQPTPTPGNTGSVVTTIDALDAPGPCLLLSTDSIDYGTLAFSTPLTPRSAFGEVSVTNCNVEPEDILAQGADATGPSATWTLGGPPGPSANMCDLASGGINEYGHAINDGPVVTVLTNSNQTYQAGLPPATDVLTNTTFHMPCSGSDGAGELLSTSITFTAVAGVPLP